MYWEELAKCSASEPGTAPVHTLLWINIFFVVGDYIGRVEGLPNVRELMANELLLYLN